MGRWLDLNAFLGLPVTQWMYAVVAVLVTYFLIIYVLRFAVSRLEAFAAHTSTRFDDMAVEVLKRTHRFAIAMAALLVGSQFLSLPDKWGSRIEVGRNPWTPTG